MTRKIKLCSVIAGGSLLAISKIVEPTISLNLFLAIVLRPRYVDLILMGFVIKGLGGLRIFRDNNLYTHNKELVEDEKNVRKD
jgi:hypothetical protein